MMRGGEMDPSTLEQLDPAFGAALEKMRPGQISEVVESQFGFHIIQLLDKRGRLYHFRHILLHPVYTTEELGGSLNTLDSLVKVIRNDSITFGEGCAALFGRRAVEDERRHRLEPRHPGAFQRLRRQADRHEIPQGGLRPFQEPR